MKDIMKYERLVESIASKYKNYSDFNDLKQVGMIGLIKAINNYKKNNNTKFETYAYLWIKGEILEYVRCDRNIKYSKNILKLNKEINLINDKFLNKFNRYAKKEEIISILGCSDYEYDLALKSKDYILSSNLEYDNNSIYDYIPYYENGYNEEIIDLHNAINNLDDLEKEIIYLRYYNDLTQSETGKKLNLNQVNISRKEEKILKKLNKNML